MAENRCPSCGAALPAHAPGGNCPRCLLMKGLKSHGPGVVTGSNGGTRSHAPGSGSVLDTIAATVGPLPRVLLRDTAVGEEMSPIVRPSNGHDTSTRYRIDGEIARGGMGSILKGRDPDLGCDVAIKVLREDLSEDTDLIRRFVEEAQIGGQLQHPGVVPIYELGTFADRRPFFCMKLVKGQTLADLLAARSSPADDLPRFLAVFSAMAQTMAYAHTRGVIHRDLKPSNVMVGSFGEVQVMDWGLAKVLARGGIANDARAGKEKPPETMIATARSGSELDLSHAGSILGTPSYMAPEQARGEPDLIDERADVFALGSILCEILTGSPAFTGRNSGEIVRRSSQGLTAKALARLDASGADAELIALANDCLEAEPEDRPHDANVVSTRMTGYLDGVQERLQTAEREQAVAVVREAEQRQTRKAQLWLAAALFGMLLCGGAIAFWRIEQTQAARQREARNAEAVAGLLNQCEEALRGNDAARAADVLEAAKKRSAEGGAEKDAPRIKRLAADLAVLRDLDAVDQFRWTVEENKFPDPAVVATRIRESLSRFGADPTAVSVDDATARVSASVVRERIVSTLDRLAVTRKGAEVRTLLRKVDADPYRDAVRDAFLADDRAKLAQLADEEAALRQPPGFVALLGEAPAISVTRRRELLTAAVTRRPGDLGLLMTLGGTYPINKKEGADERVRWNQAAIAAAPNNTAALHNLGTALADTGHSDEAIACYNKAIELDPKFVYSLNGLGNELRKKGQLDEAIACFNKAIELKPNFASAHNNLGIVFSDKGQLDEAIACYNKAIDLEPKIAVPHYSLGNAMRSKGQLDAAIVCYKRAIELDQKYAYAYIGLGFAIQDEGQLDAAIAYFQKAIQLNPELTVASTKLATAKRMAATRERFPAFQKGSYTPATNDERLGLIEWCGVKKLNHAAVALYSAAFAADPRLGDDLGVQHRYNASCDAALAAAGQGEDAAKLDDAERTRLRKQALDWLQADLALWTKRLESAQPADRDAAAKTLRHWQQDPDLAGIRDAAALAKLPEPERREWQTLWADVERLLGKP